MPTVVFTAHAAGRAHLEEIRLVLDAVAHRISRDAWAGSLSDEAIQSVRLSLKKRVRRKAFVAARQVQGFSHKRMRILWTLGRANLTGVEGDWVIKSRSLSSRSFSPGDRMRRIGEIAYAAGIAHDLGKNTQAFQDKLRGTQRLADRFRHELLSLAQWRGKAWDDGLSSWTLATPVVGSGDRTPSSQPTAAPHNRPPDWLEYLVLTHHRLPGVLPGGDVLDLRADKHINDRVAPPANLQSPDALMRQRMRSDEWRNPVEGRMDFVLSRLSLMLADHYVSSVREATPESQKRPSALRGQVFKHLQAASAARANPSQSLAGHLNAVGTMARVIAPTLGDGRWMTGLTALQSGRFASAAGSTGRFAWQQQAVHLSRRYAKGLPNGIAGLALVGSSTGSGKTRACLALADALSNPQGPVQPLRVTVALGLRTLTLQTGHEYREAFKMDADDLSVLIGSRAALALDAQARSQTPQYGQDPLKTVGRDEGRDFDDDADPRELNVTEDDPSRAIDLLPFIEAQCGRPGQKRYLDAPVMVTTLDQIIQAADHRRAGWILPWLRLMSSSALILDEVDGYDLSDFLPLLRLVEFAAMLGVPVIASSATLYPAFVTALVGAWQHGAKDRARFLGVSFDRPACLLVGDEPDVSRIANASDIEQEFASYARAMTANLAPRRIGRIVGEDAKTKPAMFESMKSACLNLHASHRIQTGLGTGLSVGLVRIAHVKQAVAFAQFLDQSLGATDGPAVRVVLYHSRNTVLARALIERRLDQMLNRKKDPLAPMQDPGFKRAVERAAEKRRDVCLIVIATSVEEVGRDHDFDWAVIEPSSARSVVQACGRVLRHRDVLPQVWNVGVLARNFREIEGAEKGRRRLCFYRPGFETERTPFPDHDMTGAWVRHLPKDRQHPAGPLIDARMCLTAAPNELGALENASIQRFLEAAFVQEWSAKPWASLVRNHYANHRFRRTEGDDQETEVVLDFTLQSFSQDHQDVGRIDGAALEIVSVLPKTALWNPDWAQIQQEFEGIDVSGKAFHALRIPYAKAIITQLSVDPLYGAVKHD